MLSAQTIHQPPAPERRFHFHEAVRVRHHLADDNGFPSQRMSAHHRQQRVRHFGNDHLAESLEVSGGDLIEELFALTAAVIYRF